MDIANRKYAIIPVPIMLITKLRAANPYKLTSANPANPANPGNLPKSIIGRHTRLLSSPLRCGADIVIRFSASASKPLCSFADSTRLSSVIAHYLYLLPLLKPARPFGGVAIQAMNDLQPDAMQGGGSADLGFDQAYDALSSEASGVQPGHDDGSLNGSAPIGGLRSRGSSPRQQQRPKRVACKECRQAKVRSQTIRACICLAFSMMGQDYEASSIYADQMVLL
jgi:hypothetical protein